MQKMIAELPETQRKDIIHMLESSVAEHGRTINLTDGNDLSKEKNVY